jgi:hypothetical protein
MLTRRCVKDMRVLLKDKNNLRLMHQLTRVRDKNNCEAVGLQVLPCFCADIPRRHARATARGRSHGAATQARTGSSRPHAEACGDWLAPESGHAHSV